MPPGLRLLARTAPLEAQAVCGASVGTAPARSAETPRGAPGSASHARYARSPHLLRPTDRAASSRGSRGLVHILWRTRARMAAKLESFRLLLSPRLAFRL